MSINQITGTWTRSGGFISAVGKQCRLINLKGVKRVQFQFDPFHEKAIETRHFLFYLTGKTVRKSNPLCTFKTDVVCDRSSPKISFHLIPPVQEQSQLKVITFEAENLSALELLKLTNKYVTTLAPPEEEVTVAKTKSEKTKARAKAK